MPEIKGYSLEPKAVPPVETEFRTIKTKIPVPESIPILKKLWSVEARSLAPWQFPILWDKAIDYNVYDKFGNKWLDLSGGIAVANAGHARKEVVEAIVNQARHGLLYNFTFPSEVRLNFIEKLVKFTSDVAPYLNKVFLMSSGSEACENVLKLSRKYQHEVVGPEKNIMITFDGAFHGRTLGAQMMGGLPDLKDWIKNPDPDIYQVPFPDGYYNEDTSFECFEKSLEKQGVNPAHVAAVFVEPAQGANVHIMPKDYVMQMRKWCNDHGALLCFDEVQTGFGRMGTKYGFLHYGVEADVISLGKGISGSLPLSATIARERIMDVFPPGTMTSTHTGNAIACAAGIATLELYERENLIQRAKELGEKILQPRIRAIADKYDTVGVATGVGMFGGIQIVEPGSKTPNKQRCYDINQRLAEKGVMMFAPVGKACCKFAPPFNYSEAALSEAMDVVDEAVGEIVKEQNLS